VRVSVAENPRGLLFVAEVSGKETRQVAMLPWRRVVTPEAKPRFRIVARQLVSQDEPVLDFALVDSGTVLLALSPARVIVYRMTDRKWTTSGQAALSLARPVARDPRGRMTVGAGSLQVYLPGTTCRAEATASLRFTCASGSEPWPLDSGGTTVQWISERNVLESTGSPGEFYSAGAGVFAGVDGHVKDQQQRPVAGTEGWGSDLAAVPNPCGAASLVVASAGGGSADRVQVFEIADGQAVAASEPLAVPGVVTALWPSEAPGEVTLVVRNSKTGTYEASRLGLACAE
jgi:hypothetical protein